MEIVTKQYLENNLIAYDNYRGLGKIGQANGIATLDANGTLSSAQVPSNVVTTSSTSLMTAAEKTKLAGISDGATSTEVTEGDIESTDPNAYVVGTIKVDDAIIDLYGKDTTYQKAQNNSLGLVMPGTKDNAPTGASPDNDWYPVAIDSAGHMYAQIPARKKWTTALNGQITATVTNAAGTGSYTNYAGIRLSFPSNVLCAKLLYSPYSLDPQNATSKIAYRNPGNNNAIININIPPTESVIKTASNNQASYIYTTLVTNNSSYDLILKINLYGKNSPFTVDIL